MLYAQQNKARGEAVAQMKADGIEYEERMERLENVTYPKPLEELLTAAYEIYRGGHPWVEDYQIAPKTVVRDMSEQAMNFVDFVGYYGLARSEGVVLRYLANAYRALRQTVPDDAKTDEVRDLIEWLGELVRQTDSSLLDEWEQLRNPAEMPAAQAIDNAPPPVTANVRAFRVLVRNAMFRRVELASLRRYLDLGDLDPDGAWNAEAWQDALAPYFDEHRMLQTGADARGPARLLIEQEPKRWLVRQIFDDPAGDHDWGISAEVDLEASDEAGVAVVRVTAVDRL